MTGFAIGVFLLVGAGAIFGFFRGFVEEILSLAAWIFAVFAIRYMHTPLTAFLEPHIGTPSGASVLGFALLLLVPYGLVKLVDHRELAANDWSLTPGRYVGVAPEEVDEDFDFEEAIREIHVELEDLNSESVILAKKIKKNFEELGI